MPYENYDRTWWQQFVNPVAYAEEPYSVEDGVASYYTNESVDPRWGGVTRSGEKFDETKMTVAVPPRLWGQLRGKTLKITDLKSGNSVKVKVNDTGGFTKYGRDVDLSKAAFEKLAPLKQGLTRVKIKVAK